MKPLPRLLAFTDQRVAELSDLARRAASLASLGGLIALVARQPSSTTNQLTELALLLAETAKPQGATLLVVGRGDLAAAVGAGVLLGKSDLPIGIVRQLVGDFPVLALVHSVEEAQQAANGGADGLVAGTIWETPSHPGRPGAGPGLIERIVALGKPVWAIGGVTPERSWEAARSGAYGVAAIRAAWDGNDPRQNALSLTLPWRAG